MKKLLTTTLLTGVFASSIYAADGSNLVNKEEEIIKSNKAYAYNVKLNQVSPQIYSAAIETAKLEQMEEIKELLKKIVDNQNKLLIATARKR